jgi:DNA-directed RNA polymerase alpha subunit
MAPDTPSSNKRVIERALLRRDDIIEELEFNSRLVRLLKNAGILTLGQLVTKTEGELEEIHGIGPGNVLQIKEVLEGDGLQLGMQLPDKPA